MASLYESMTKRMQAVQQGQPDPGNPDLYGYNQTQPGATAPTTWAGGGGGSPQSTSGALQGTATAGQQIPQGTPTTVAGAFQQALVNRLAPAPVSVNSPEIAPAIDANRYAEQRNLERQRANLAEQAAANGYNDTGAFQGRLTGLFEDQAARQAAFEGNLVQSLAKQRSDELTAALALGGSMLSDADRQALQRELAQLDAQVRREALSQQGSLGGRELDIRDKLGTGQLNLGLLSSLLNNQQFGQNLGAQLGMFGANLNQQALLSLLGGL